MFVLSIFLVWPTYILADNTILPWKYLLLIPTIGMALAAAALYKTSPYNLYWTIFLAVCMGTILSLFSILLINKLFPQSPPIVEKFDILYYGNKLKRSRSFTSNCAMPYVTILIQGKRKQLELTCDDLETAESYEKIECNYHIGAFGWAYLNEYLPKKWEP